MTLPVGTRLMTKDGTKVGNAIVIAIIPAYGQSEDGYLIETDFGNRMRQHIKTIDEFWTYDLSEKPDIDRWLHDRKRNINR